ncbi:MAG: DNA mismatch repair protein MutS, partial [Thermodesulfobacteriota bacterium]
MRQYLDIKSGCKDAVLFFRMGDFYEMFFEDAKLASRALGIALTTRDKERDIPMCGVPYHAAGGYITKLVRKGHKVAICEQMEQPGQGKGPVERAVTRIVTPGVALEDELLESGSNNFIGAACRGTSGSGFAYMDVSTGEFRITDVKDGDSLTDEIARINPSELVLQESTDTAGLPVRNVTFLAAYDFKHDVSLERLTAQFGVASLDGFGCSDLVEGTRAAGALLHYVRDTQKADLGHLRRCTPYYPGDYLVMDHATRRNLEITENMRSGDRTDTLLSLLDRTRTAMGGRRLREWLTYPLVDEGEIRTRLDGVEEFVESREVSLELEELLSGVHDLERLIGRVSLGIASPRDLVSLKESLKKVPELKQALGGFRAPITAAAAASLDGVPEAVELIEGS